MFLTILAATAALVAPSVSEVTLRQDASRTVTVNGTLNITGGTFDDTLTWTLDKDGTLTVSGTGEMKSSPWRWSWETPNRTEDIKKVVIENGVKNVRSYAFDECKNLIIKTLYAYAYAVYFCCL